MVVQHNLTAMNANRMLGITQGTMAKTTEKLSSGYKINRAADDAAGLSISEKMRKQIRGLTQASLNAEDGISAVQTAEGALNEVQDMLQRMNELAVKAANGTNSADDRSYIQDEINQLITEIDRVAETTKFNETYLLKGDRDAQKITTFEYATPTTAKFGEGISALYTEDGTELSSPEALLEYLEKNPEAKIYKTPASAEFSSTSGSIESVTVKKGAEGAPETETQYKFGDDGKWYKKTTESSTTSVASENGGLTSDWVEATDEVKKLFNITGNPQAGDTITFKPAVEAEKGTDYIITEGTVGNTGLTSSNPIVDKLKAFESEASFSTAVLNNTNGQVYLMKTGEKAVDGVHYNTVQTVSHASGVSHLNYAYKAAGSDTYTIVSSEEKLFELMKDVANTKADATSSISLVKLDTAGTADATVDAGSISGGTKVTIDSANEVMTNSTKKTVEIASGYSYSDFGYLPSDGDAGDEPASMQNFGGPAAGVSYGGPATANYGVMQTAGDSEGTGSVSVNVTSKPINFYDENGNKISENALSNYLEYDETRNSVSFKDDAPRLYTDEAATTLATNNDIQDGIMVNQDELVGALEFKLHVGADATSNNQIAIKIDAMSAKGLGVNEITVDGDDDTGALDAIGSIKEAIQKVSKQRSALGAIQNRLEHTINNLDNVVENTTAAESQIRDTDMATEMVKYSNNNILAQAGQSMLAQANQSNQGVLSLLG